MTAPSPLSIGYAMLLLIALLAPYVGLGTPQRTGDPRPNGLPTIALTGAAALILTLARPGGLYWPSLILLIPLIRHSRHALLGGAVAVLLFAPVVWWTPQLQLGPVASAGFVALALVAAYLPSRDRSAESRHLPRLLAPMLLAGVVGLTAGLLTAPFEADTTTFTAWHHWGAYISPAEAWLAGGVPFRDFPIQYGLGPTMLLTATCQGDCWRGLYGLTVGANTLYVAILTGCAVILTANCSHGMRWLAVAATICASLIWTGFPTDFAGPAMTPSVGGLRFLTIAALLFHILRAEHGGRPRDWIGHGIWLIDMLWSPEGAAFGTLIWWPYLALRAVGRARGASAMVRAFCARTLWAVAALAGAAILLGAILWRLSGTLPTLTEFLAYIQHPPGPMPVNPVGTLWLALVPVLLAIPLLIRDGRNLSVYACLLGLLAAGSYYLSRSHDNNILNLFPLLVLLLLAIATAGGRRAITGDDFTGGFTRTVLAAMIAFVATFNFGPWALGIATDHGLETGVRRLIAHFDGRPDDPMALLSPDATAGLAWLRARDAESVVLLDARKIMPRAPAGTGWTGVNNLANFEPLPEAMVARYIARGAAAYRRAGWLLVDERSYARWPALFRAAYTVRAVRRFGDYTAYHLVPRAIGAAATGKTYSSGAGLEKSLPHAARFAARQTLPYQRETEQ